MNKNENNECNSIQNIKRDELLIPENEAIWWNEERNSSLLPRGKYNLKYSKKSIDKTLSIDIIKGMCGELFFDLESKTIRKKLDGGYVSHVALITLLPTRRDNRRNNLISVFRWYILLYFS